MTNRPDDPLVPFASVIRRVGRDSGILHLGAGYGQQC